jgi:hypothetical protein
LVLPEPADKREKNVKIKAFLASIALALSASSSMAALADSCTSTTSWNSLGPPDVEIFGNSFKSTGKFLDCYTFNLSSSASAFGGVIEIDALFNKLDIDVKSVSLFLGENQIGSTDYDPFTFTFSSLAGGGLYTLAVGGSVDRDPGFWNVPVAYAGLIATIAAPVPEPGAAALMIAGLLGVGALAWRRRDA